jgi:hypothetical protein
MTDLLAGWRFALRRLSAGWRFMLVSALGVVVAATLLAVTPIYATAMSDLGLSFRLARELPDPQDRLAHIVVGGLRFGSATDRAAIEVMDRITEARVTWLGDGLVAETRSQRFDLAFPDFEAPEGPVEVPPGDATLRQPWGGYLYYLAGWEQQVDVVDGRLPQGTDPEVVLPDGFQRHAALGDTIRIQAGGFNDCPNVPGAEDPEQAAEEIRCEPTVFVSNRLDVTVVGFVRPRDAGSDRWALFEGEWTAPDVPLIPRLAGVGPNDPRRLQMARGIGQMPLLTTRAQFDEVFRHLIPEASMRHRTGVVVDTSNIGLAEVEYAVADLTSWRRDIRDRMDLNAGGRMDILQTLEGFRTAQAFTAVPLLVMLLQVVGIVIYYVVMVMAMLLERQQQEIGVYRSRGATTSQLVGLSFVEGLVFAIPALLIAPWLAAGVVSLLGMTPTFEAITGGSPLPIAVSPEAYLLAFAGGLLSLLAILLPAFLIVRRGIVDVKREEARPAERNILQRYYLDFALVGLAGLLLWQLNQQGSVFDPGAVGGWASDPLLLAAPFALTASVSLMVLRFYPPLVRLLVRALLMFRGTATAIGLRRAGRAPATYARVTLLIIMAVAVGTFAASYAPTVDRSLEDRERYRVGVDLRGRLWDVSDRRFDARMAELRELDSVAGVFGAYRGSIQPLTGGGIPLLAVDPEGVREAVWWRDDFATDSLDGLMAHLESPVPPSAGYVIPADAVTLQIEVLTPYPTRFVPRARFRHEDGRYVEGFLRSPDAVADQWGTWSVDVPPADGALTFVGLHVGDRADGTLRLEGALYLDDLAVVRADGSTLVLDSFEGPQRWMMFNLPETRERLEVSRDEAATGAQSLRWDWVSLIQPRTRVFAPVMPGIPVTALMDQSAMASFRTEVGGLAFASFDGVAVPLDVRAMPDYFPTLDPAVGMVIVNYEHLREAAGLLAYPTYAYPTELWVQFEDGVSIAEQRQVALGLQEGLLQPRVDRNWLLQSVEVQGATADPTLQAAGSGILAVAFVAVIGLSTVGFVASMTLGARARATEFAVLRAVGVSRGEVLRAMFLEWAIVLALGAVVGAVVGRQVAEIMLRFLNVTETGSAVLPPFVLETSWGMLGLGLGALTGVVAASLVVSWIAAMRRPPTVELRITQ